MKKETKKNFLLMFMLLLFNLGMAAPSLAHSEDKDLWQLDTNEIQKLRLEVEEHRIAFIDSLAKIESLDESETNLERTFSFDSNKYQLNTDQSLLGSLILHSMNWELKRKKLYAFCGGHCEKSLFNDLKNHPDRNKIIGELKQMWPKLKDSFELLWKDIPLAFWSRLIHFNKYSSYLWSKARFQGRNYGPVSMMAGALAFSGAFVVTEALESLILVGPLHFFCQANYIWSLAFGAGVAGFYTKASSMFFFGKDGRSILSAFKNTFFGFKMSREFKDLEKTIIFPRESDLPKQYKTSRREAWAGELRDFVGGHSPTSIASSHYYYWADTLEGSDSLNKKVSLEKKPKLQLLFGDEVDRIFLQEENSFSQHYWHELFSALDLSISLFKLDLDLQDSSINKNQSLSQLGKLRSLVTKLDIFMQLLIEERRKNSDTSSIEDGLSAKWLNRVLFEILSLGIDISSKQDQKKLDLRLRRLEKSINTSLKNASANSQIRISKTNFQASLKRERIGSSKACAHTF